MRRAGSVDERWIRRETFVDDSREAGADQEIELTVAAGKEVDDGRLCAANQVPRVIERESRFLREDARGEVHDESQAPQPSLLVDQRLGIRRGSGTFPVHAPMIARPNGNRHSDRRFLRGAAP